MKYKELQRTIKICSFFLNRHYLYVLGTFLLSIIIAYYKVLLLLNTHWQENTSIEIKLVLQETWKYEWTESSCKRAVNHFFITFKIDLSFSLKQFDYVKIIQQSLFEVGPGKGQYHMMVNETVKCVKMKLSYKINLQICWFFIVT